VRPHAPGSDPRRRQSCRGTAIITCASRGIGAGLVAGYREAGPGLCCWQATAPNIRSNKVAANRLRRCSHADRIVARWSPGPQVQANHAPWLGVRSVAWTGQRVAGWRRPGEPQIGASVARGSCRPGGGDVRRCGGAGPAGRSASTFRPEWPPLGAVLAGRAGSGGCGKASTAPAGVGLPSACRPALSRGGRARSCQGSSLFCACLRFLSTGVSWRHPPV
jgi:hypothetical protein